jgi:hydrogenase expression/formation protein HypD
MKYIDEYRDPALAEGLISSIKKRSQKLKRQINIMEVCGTHTHSISRFGIRDLLPDNIRLISGPGCPVCVTSIEDIDIALYLAARDGVIFTTFGDMLRVPGTDGITLEKIRSRGAEIEVVSSAMGALDLEEKNKGKEVILMGIGFETTSPTIASVVKTAKKRGIENFSVFSVHKVIPPAIKALLADQNLNIDGFLCPGHVSTIIGTKPYSIITEKNHAAVISGFEPIDILEGIFMILGQMIDERWEVEIQYKRGVKADGNPNARAALEEVFEVSDANWRGLGMIPDSGLVFNEKYEYFDALKRFDVPAIESKENQACSCGDILKGLMSPDECPLFREVCTPRNPVGPCMVSSEGACAAYYKYH